MSPESFIVGACATGGVLLVIVGIVAHFRARAAKWERLNDRIFDAEKEARDLRWTLDALKRDAKEFRESLETAGDCLQTQHDDIERLATHLNLEFRDVNAHRRLSPINRA